MGNESSSASSGYPGERGGRAAGASPTAGARSARETAAPAPEPGPGAGGQQPRPYRIPAGTKPGAYSMAGTGRRGSQGGESTPYTVTVPAGVRTGQEFQIVAGGTQMMVRCPENIGPGDRIMVMVPRPARPQQSNNRQQVYMATVPAGVQPGGDFNVMVNDRPVIVTCPEGVRPGMQIRIRLPDPGTNAAASNLMQQTFEVTVPQGVRAGQPFALMANNQRVMVHCPHDARPGQKIRFQLPIQINEDMLQTFTIHYNKDGWVRCVGTDLKFHWVRHNSDSNPSPHPNGKKSLEGESKGGHGKLRRGSSGRRKVNVEGSTFSVEGSAFVRELVSTGARHWSLDLVRAEAAVLESSVPEAQLTFQHLSRVSQQTYQQKVTWFQQQCDNLRISWDIEHQHIKVRRNNLLDDSMRALESIRINQMRQRFRYEFIGEPGIDAGGVAREWFHVTSEQLFNPDFALFQYSSINQMCMQINPSSGVANDEHLQYFHFAGRLLGKALFDAQLVSAHLARPLYKHLLGWPLSFSDLEHIDHFTHDSLLKMTELEDVEVCALDFTVTEDRMGNNTVVELKRGGEAISVTNDNFDEYMELILKHRLMGRIREQLTAFLVGFYDVIPEALLSVFDFQELELLMCGLPTIDLEDWARNTDYAGEFERKGANHKVVRWFWEVLQGFKDEQRARLLQFVTGTSGVPSQGFAVLQGNDGNIRKFTLNGAPLDGGLFPRAHTCFNRIDLPMYESKGDLQQYLSLAIQLEATGFDID